MRTVSCEKRDKNWYNWELWKGIPPTELHPNCAPRSVDKTRCFEVVEGNYSQSVGLVIQDTYLI